MADIFRMIINKPPLHEHWHAVPGSAVYRVVLLSPLSHLYIIHIDETISATGGLGNTTTICYKRLASMIATKRHVVVEVFPFFLPSLCLHSVYQGIPLCRRTGCETLQTSYWHLNQVSQHELATTAHVTLRPTNYRILILGRYYLFPFNHGQECKPGIII